jgi:hypothetical protein
MVEVCFVLYPYRELDRRKYNIFIPGSEIERYSERALKLTRRGLLDDF